MFAILYTLLRVTIVVVPGVAGLQRHGPQAMRQVDRSFRKALYVDIKAVLQLELSHGEGKGKGSDIP